MRDYAFGNLVTRLRTVLGFSQFQLGRLIGVSDKASQYWRFSAERERRREVLELILEMRTRGTELTDDLPRLNRSSRGGV